MISLIDVIWIEPKTREVVCAFEVEKSTSIYSGILRMEDLARSMPERKGHFYIVAPHLRGKQVLAQFRRPSFREHLSDMSLAYISFENLRKHFDALCKFGADYTVLQKITTEGFEVA